MDTVPFIEQTTVYARHQPQYRELPAYKFADPIDEGRIVCCWRLTWRERMRVLITGRIWHQILTFNHALQPQLLSVEKPHMPERKQ